MRVWFTLAYVVRLQQTFSANKTRKSCFVCVERVQHDCGRAREWSTAGHLVNGWSPRSKTDGHDGMANRQIQLAWLASSLRLLQINFLARWCMLMVDMSDAFSRGAARAIFVHFAKANNTQINDTIWCWAIEDHERMQLKCHCDAEYFWQQTFRARPWRCQSSNYGSKKNIFFLRIIYHPKKQPKLFDQSYRQNRTRLFIDLMGREVFNHIVVSSMHWHQCCLHAHRVNITLYIAR